MKLFLGWIVLGLFLYSFVYGLAEGDSYNDLKKETHYDTYGKISYWFNIFLHGPIVWVIALWEE